MTRETGDQAIGVEVERGGGWPDVSPARGQDGGARPASFMVSLRRSGVG